MADLLADPATNLSRPADRDRVVARMAGIENARRQNARARAAARGLPLRIIQPNGRIQEITDFSGDEPVYFTTENANAAISTGANLLRTSPYSLSGAGLTIGIWDGGSARTTHQEFGGRVTVKDGAASIDHATHVGGTLIASGVDPAARGMAGSALLDSYEWTNDTSEMTARGATAPGQAGAILLSNHSYGYVSGWNQIISTTRTWEWYGSGTSASSIEDDFGRYNTYARDHDSLAYNAPYYLIFRSAGNDRTDNPVNGQNIALSPGGTAVVYNSATHPGGDGNYRGGFETIGFNALGKNVITVGSVLDAVTGGARDPAMASINSFSSWGPTDDGRIKPDVVANGDRLKSSLNGANNAYGEYSGTSMATPNACGSAALLIQQYAGLFPGQAMRSSTLKGLLIHTADDRGNPGPDYKFGWGLVNVKAAADLLIDHQASPAKQRVGENQLTTSTTNRAVSFVWDGVSPITATLCWTDPAGAATSTSDLRTPRLVNNLNLKLIAPNGSEFLPYVMPFVGNWSQASMDSPAVTGVNNTDNVEQVRVAAPALAGAWQAVVSFSGTLTNGAQNYSLLISGSSAEAPPPPPLALSSVSPDSGFSGETVTLDLTGTGLRADTTVKLSRPGSADITATSVQLIGQSIRCQVDLTGAAAGDWNVVATNPDQQSSTLAAAFSVIGALWYENFDGTVTGWTSQATTGSNAWTLTTAQSQTPVKSYFAPAPSSKTTTNLTSPSITIPAGASNLQLVFWHSYNLQSRQDGGRLELSIDGGAWFDALASGSGASFGANGYNNTIRTSSSSEFAGLSAWTGNSNGFIETVLNLPDSTKYAGHSLRLRWRLATNSGTASTGWYVDSILLVGAGGVPNLPPAITNAATMPPGETQTDPDDTIYQVLRGTSVALTASASDDGGEPALTYTWSLAGGPGAPVLFSANGTSAAKNTTASFDATGDYRISLTVTDAQGLTASSPVNVRVLQSASGLVITPALVSLPFGASRNFGASLLDQFGLPMSSQPPSFTWFASGGGTISPEGIYTATNAGGPYSVTVSSGAFSDTATITVTRAPATITLGGLNQTRDGNPKPVTVSTDPPGLAVAVTYDSQSSPPVEPGSYAVLATITDPNHEGAAAANLVIAPGNDWASWTGEHFTAAEKSAGLAADNADPDADGLPNLAEFALGTAPRDFTPPLAATLDAAGLSLTFTRPAGLPGVSYSAQSSDGLGNWSPVPLQVITPGDPETVRARDSLATGDPSRRFLRLRFVRE